MFVACSGDGSGGEAQARTTSPVPSAAAPQSASNNQFDGRIIAMNATKLRAPQNTFRINGWNSNSGWIKLLHLAEDGKEIKEGEVVARFEFDGKQALPRVEERIQRAEADRDRAGLDVSSELRQMQTAQQQKALDAERAGLDTLKQGVVSARDLERFEIAHDLAKFESGAQGKQIDSYKRSIAADKAYQDQNVSYAQSDLERYKVYENRFVVRAPHDGVVRHGYYSWRRRKVQKGDGMPGGMHFASVARDKSLAVEIFIPEHRYGLLRDQKRFIVKSPSSSKRYEVEVTKVERFPQELGFVKQNDDLPDAREKIYVLQAEFVDASYDELSAGLDVKVVMP